MSDQENLRPNRPTHRAYVVKNNEKSGKSRWIEIGAGWLHKDGKGFRVSLDACPTNGEPIELRMIDWAKIDAGQQENAPEEAPDDY